MSSRQGFGRWRTTWLLATHHHRADRDDVSRKFAGKTDASLSTSDTGFDSSRGPKTDLAVVFSVTCIMVFALHPIGAWERSLWTSLPAEAMMRWIHFAVDTASLVSLFLVRPPRAHREAIRAIETFAPPDGSGREHSSNGDARDFMTGDRECSRK